MRPTSSPQLKKGSGTSHPGFYPKDALLFEVTIEYNPFSTANLMGKILATATITGYYGR